MASRRSGSPPFDDSPSPNATSRETPRSGFWASVKRALTGNDSPADPEAPGYLDLVAPTPTFSSRDASRDAPALPPAGGRAWDAKVPFLPGEGEPKANESNAALPRMAHVEESAAIRRVEVDPAGAEPPVAEAPNPRLRLEPVAAPAPDGETAAPPRPDPPQSPGEPSLAAPEAEELSRAASPEPQLARGLASFSSRNSERGKRFAHLLKDAPADKKPAPRSGRRR